MSDTISDQEIKEFLSHHGVKGQKWGVRNQERDIRKANERNQKYIDKHITNKTGIGTGSPLRSLRRAQVGPSGEKLSRKDRKWQANIYSTNAWIHLHNKAADIMNSGEIEKFNNRPHFKNHQGGFVNPDGSPKEDAMSKRYYKEYGDLFASHVDKIVKSDPTAISPSGKYKATVSTMKDPDGFLNFNLDVLPTGVRHANASSPEFHFELNLDDMGRVISVRKIKTEMAQGATVEDFLSYHGVKETELAQSYISNGIDFLEHHGVKGQKWGIRNRLRKTFGFPVRSSQPHGSHDPSNKGSNTLVKTKKFVKAHQHGIILGTKIALTAAFIAVSLKADGSRRVKDIPNSSSYTKHAGTVKDVIHAEHSKQASSLLRMHQEGKMDKDQYAHFKKILDARYAKKIMDAA